MNKICANDRSFVGMYGALVKLYKINNFLKQQLATTKNNGELSKMKYVEKVVDLKAFLKEKTANLFRHAFVMAHSSNNK